MASVWDLENKVSKTINYIRYTGSVFIEKHSIDWFESRLKDCYLFFFFLGQKCICYSRQQRRQSVEYSEVGDIRGAWNAISERYYLKR